MYSDRRGTDKNHPGQNLPDKRLPDKKLRTKPPRIMDRELVQGLLSGFFVVGLLKIGGGSEMCDLLLGVQGCVTTCDRRTEGGGLKFAKNSMTYFMDGPTPPYQHTQCHTPTHTHTDR